MLMRLVAARNWPIVGRLVHALLAATYNIEIPSSVRYGPGFRFVHHGFGSVIHPDVTFGRNCTVFHGVTIGRYDAARVGGADTKFDRIEIGDDVILYPGAVVLGGPGVTRIASGTVVGANAVLIGDTDGGTWVGAPARRA